jgi:HEAT repeat protein
VAIVEALSRLGGPNVIEPLIAMGRHKEAHVRVAAAEALGCQRAAGETIEPLLLNLLKDKSWDVRRAATEALGRLRADRALEGLTSALGDSDSDVRETAVRALAVKGPAGHRAVDSTLKDPSKSASGDAAALSRIEED